MVSSNAVHAEESKDSSEFNSISKKLNLKAHLRAKFHVDNEAWSLVKLSKVSVLK